jgi:hypothetical protein
LCALIVPVIAWARHGTQIYTQDILRAVMPAMLSALCGAGAASGVAAALVQVNPFARFVAEVATLFAVQVVVLVFLPCQRRLWGSFLRAMQHPARGIE